jgi:type IV secretory pathway TrbD component
MRQVKLHKSIIKPKLVMGCERGPFMVVFITSLLLLVEGSFSVKIAGAVFFFLSIGIIAFLNRKDPFFFKILFRFLREQEFYPASADFPSRPANPNNKDK